MSNYRITATQFAVYPEETTYCDPDATIVTLQGELGEDEHFSIRQGDHVIYLDPEELEPLLEACKRLRGQSAQSAPVDPFSFMQQRTRRVPVLSVDAEGSLRAGASLYSLESPADGQEQAPAPEPPAQPIAVDPGQLHDPAAPAQQQRWPGGVIRGQVVGESIGWIP